MTFVILWHLLFMTFEIYDFVIYEKRIYDKCIYEKRIYDKCIYVKLLLQRH